MLEFAGSPNAEATEFAVQRCGGVDRGEAKEMEPPGSNGSCILWVKGFWISIVVRRQVNREGRREVGAGVGGCGSAEYFGVKAGWNMDAMSSAHTVPSVE